MLRLSDRLLILDLAYGQFMRGRAGRCTHGLLAASSSLRKNQETGGGRRQRPGRRLAPVGCLLLWSLTSSAGHYSIPLFVSPAMANAPQGVLRVLNPTDTSGTVTVHAVDDAGTRSGPATFTLGAYGVAEFDATDLANGNALKGLSGGLGAANADRRLEIDTGLEIDLAAYVRGPVGTLAVMHDTVREIVVAGRSRYEVPLFNPAIDLTQASRLRLINPGDAATAVTIGARDESSVPASGGEVRLTLPPGGARTLTAQQLEAGDASIQGRLGAGVGRWILSVAADRPIRVVNVAVTPAGDWNNLSTSAVQGYAPADHAAFNQRVDGLELVYETGDGRFTLVPGEGDRYTETGQRDGIAMNQAGGYRYARTGPDSGRLTLTYDGGETCRADFHFTTRMYGWFASRCTRSDDSTARWLGGTWVIDDGVDTSPNLGGTGPGDQRYTTGTAIATLRLPGASGGDGALTYSLSPGIPGLSFDPDTLELTGTPTAAGTYGMVYKVADTDGDTDSRQFTISVVDSGAVADGACQPGLVLMIGERCTYPGTDDAFTVNERGRGSFLTYLAGIRIRLVNITVDGQVYDLVASHQGDGVWHIDRVAGNTEPPGGDTSPDFGSATGPGDQPYTAGTAIGPLSLPTAGGGDGDLVYSLSPVVPGLIFDGATRQLTGTPSMAGMYAMTYTATDSDGDIDTRTFTITVVASDAVAEGDCYAGLTVAPGDNCTYPGTDAAFAVDAAGHGSFLLLSGDAAIRIDNQTIAGRLYDFAASNQGRGVWRIDRVAGRTESPAGDGDTGTGQERYRGVRVAPENRCSEYDSGDYPYPPSVED